MKKNLLSVIFVAFVMAVFAVPFVCMSFAPTNTSTENRRLAQFPRIMNDNEINKDFLGDLGTYFEDHFAFRNAIVAADGKIQSLFGVSAVDTVIKGENGWLYYTSSADDFQGLNVMSDREAENAENNLRILNDYVKNRGALFCFTVAPNKNALYPDNMPYYYLRTDLPGNMAKLAPRFETLSYYADLFSLFRGTDETLYMKRDSHWNNKGALLASNALLDAVGKEHDAFDTVAATRKKDAVGDLGRMAYSVWAEPEWNYTYELPGAFTYTDTDDVEAALVTTVNPSAEGTLLMFRDSFANTMIPVIAESYRKAVFSKALPFPMERYMNEYSPETVIVEKVERNLRDFSRTPPLISAPAADLAGRKRETLSTETAVSAAVSPDDADYYVFTGEIRGVEGVNAVYVQLDGSFYEAFTVSSEETDNAFLLYLKKEILSPEAVNAAVVVDCGGALKTVYSGSIDLSGGVEE